jgi:hypothetical protein
VNWKKCNGKRIALLQFLSAVHFQQHLTLLSFLLKEDYGAFARQLRDGGDGLEAFAQFISRHQLQLFGFSRLNGSPIRQCIPSRWLGSLRGAYLSRWAAQERLVRELVALQAPHF